MKFFLSALAALGVSLLACWPAARVFAEVSATFDAAWLYRNAVVDGIVLADNDAALQLASGQLYEDDGPAAGYCYGPNVEKLGGEVAAEKTLIVPNPQARSALLLVAPGGDLRVKLFGQSIELGEPRKLGNYWQARSFDPAVLRKGKNPFILQGSGALWIARDQDFAAGSRTRSAHPNRSAKSSDGGRTWDDARLGSGDDLDGEYYVRLWLDHYQPSGELTLPVLDVLNLEGKSQLVETRAAGEITIEPTLPAAAKGAIEIEVRSGTTLVPAAEHWSRWMPLQQKPGQPARLDQPRGRYVQIRVRLQTADPLTTPQLESLTVRSAAAGDAPSASWAGQVKITDADNPPIVRSSIPFEYEPYDHPDLALLRRKYKLDEVVAGAETELELMEKLAVWSSQRWPKLGHLGEGYPPWDATEILKLHDDGTPVGGFCQQFSLIFLQACESFGIPGRAVSIGPGNYLHKIRGGHETVELWSNQFQKWIYFDGNTAWYAVSDEGIPLSLLELRDRQIAAWEDKPYPPLRIVRLAETRYKWTDFDHSFPFIELRLIPRSNFLARQAPLPLHQGMRGWFWTGHYVWTDDKIPARPLYSHLVRKRGNFEWTLNRPHLALEALAEPGRVRVHIDSETPGLKSYLVKTGEQQVEVTGSSYDWQLEPGRRRITVTPQNTALRQGIPSWIEVQYDR